nr:ribonuclease H-like domain-containing protein [Tanacetum cinerariifolium]
MSIFNEHRLKFNSIKDAKQLLEAIEKRFGGNVATKKTQRNLLKHQFKKFSALSSYMLNQTFDRLKKLVCQLELLGEKLSQEDVNQNLLRSLSREWNTHGIVWRNKADLDTMSMDDLYNNIKVRFLKKTRRKLTIIRNETLGFDMSKVECYNCHKRGYFARECRDLGNQDTKHKESTRRSVLVETPASIALVSCDSLGGYDWKDIKVLKVEIQMKDIAIKELRRKLEVAQKEKDGIQLTIDKLENTSKGLNKLMECQIVDNCKKGLGYKSYNAVPPPYTGNFMPLKPDLSYTGLDEFAVKHVVENKSSQEKTKKTRRKLTIISNETLGFDMSKVECYNFHKRGYFARECRDLGNQDTKHKESTRRSVLVETPASIALVSCDSLGGYDWSDQAEEGPNYALMAYTSSSSNSKVLKDEIQMKDIAIKELRRKLEVAQKEKNGIQLTIDKLENTSKGLNKLMECQIVDNCKKGLGYKSYNAVPPPYTGNFMPLKPDLSYTGLDEFAVKHVVENKSSQEKTKVVRKNTDAPIIKNWVSDDEEKNVTQPKIVKKIVRPSIVKKEFVKPRQQEKIARKTIKKVEHN